MNERTGREIKLAYGALILIFSIFLAVPVVALLIKSFTSDGGTTLSNYTDVLGGRGFGTAFGHSVWVSLVSAMTSTLIAFGLAYTIYYTNISSKLKKTIRVLAMLPMLLPTITYGFAIIYSIGKQGLLTQILGKQLFEIYGFGGLYLGYVIYTLPIAFLLIYNTMGYIDKKYIIVSKVMGDKPSRTFKNTVLRPLWGTLAASIVQSFFLCFTDYGIPASVGGKYQVVASILYDEMLGSLPSFPRGAVVAVLMLLPSIISIGMLKYLERYNIRYSKISQIDIHQNRTRDIVLGTLSSVVIILVLAIFASIFFVPFVKEWPYRMEFTFDHIASVFQDNNLLGVYRNSLWTALLTAALGVITAYAAALITARSSLGKKVKGVIEAVALVTNTIPGMVIGIAFLLIFSGTPLANTFFIIIICNVVHFFSTPYLMAKGALEKLNSSWETTAKLMGDSWWKTLLRVVTPNMKGTLLEMFSYYFVNAMVTVSAVIFIAGAGTMVITTKIKELQYYTKYNEIFVLSFLILLTNLIVKGILAYLAKRQVRTQTRGWKQYGAVAVSAALLIGIFASPLPGSGGTSEKVILYSNADEEAVNAMKETLDDNGYKGKYIFQNFGTSELGGKLLAEGKNIEADVVTMSSFYLDSAQESQDMFVDLEFPVNTVDDFPNFYAPITAQEGTIIVNTELLKEKGIDKPEKLRDLIEYQYKDMISVTDIKSSSTAWLLIQALVSEYGEEGAKYMLGALYTNAGPHIESSGSAPLKKVRAGEVAIGFGLRQQAVSDQKSGLPIEVVDPVEGNFSLTESIAVIDKGKNQNPLAMEIAACIISKGRGRLMNYYPNPLYVGEKADLDNISKYPKVFPQKLDVKLLERHQAISEAAK